MNRWTQFVLTALLVQAGCLAKGSTGPNFDGEGGGGGAGGGGACGSPSDCPTPTGACMKATCASGVCGEEPLPNGVLAAEQASGDCAVSLCDGQGVVKTVPDETDLPVDGNGCTDDVCTAGTPSNPPRASGSACAEGGGNVCNGSGACVECLAAADCPGEDTACSTRTCSAGACGIENAPIGTVVPNQAAGDCMRITCDGAGNTTSSIDDTDVPVDGKACTADVCTMGVPSNPALAIDSPCSQSGGSVCNASGACVQCNTGAQCGSGLCSAGVCLAATCGDGVKNGSESDIDCGGASCPGCGLGKVCGAGTDCASGVCTASACAAPVVVSSAPSDGQMNVAAGTTIAVTFSGAMNPATLTAQTSAGACTGTLQLSTDGFSTCLGFGSASPAMSNGGKTATWTPSPALSYQTSYALRVTTAASDTSGTPIAASYAASFATGSPCAGSIVISQVYGGGGNSGATYKNDFVELHNRGDQPMDLAGYSVQYASASGTTWLMTTLNGTIAPGGYYLIQCASGVSGSALPAADLLSATNLSGTAGKVALVADTTVLSGSCPLGANVVDFVGYGTANCSEGSATAPGAADNTQSILRSAAGCADTGDNGVDFTASAVTPRNAATPASFCACMP